MNKLNRLLHDVLPAWAAEWLDLLVPLIEVILIGLGAWLVMRNPISCGFGGVKNCASNLF